MANYYHHTSNVIGVEKTSVTGINDIEWGAMGNLFDFTSFTFTSPNEDPFAPTFSEITNQTAYQSTTWYNNSDFFAVTDGIQYFKIPETKTYRITCKGAAGKNARIAAN